MWPIWLSFWGRFDLGPIWLGPIWPGADLTGNLWCGSFIKPLLGHLGFPSNYCGESIFLEESEWNPWLDGQRCTLQVKVLCLSGVFLYWSITHWNASMSRSPLGPVLSAIRHLMVLTPTSALQLLRGKETEDRQWCIPQSWRNWLVAVTVNSGPPSDASSSGFPKVSNVRRRQVMSPAAPFEDLSTIGQFDYLSTTTR
jgi:hypothetical protein